MTSVVFLDFDGVVQTIYWGADSNGVYHTNVFKSGKDRELNNKQAIGWLNELYSRVPYDVVVTSTWRLGMNIEELQQLLIRSGFNPAIKVIGKTPVLHQDRGLEIQQWLDENQFEGPIAIIDDDSDMCHLAPYLVKCDTFVGFTFHDFKKALNFLQKT